MTFRAPAGLGLAVLMALGSVPSHSQPDPEIAARRAVIERDQQSDAFSLQLRQSQERARLAPRSLQSDAVEVLHREQRARQQALHQEQLRQLSQPRPAGGPEARAGEREHFARERRAQALEFEAEERSAVIEAPRRWTPTLEPAPRAWTPTLDGSPATP